MEYVLSINKLESLGFFKSLFKIKNIFLPMTQLVHDKLVTHSLTKDNAGGLLCHRKTSSQHDYIIVFLL